MLTQPIVVEKLEKAVLALEKFMESQGLECKPEKVSNLKGDIARAGFIDKFKEVQRLKHSLINIPILKEQQDSEAGATKDIFILGVY